MRRVNEAKLISDYDELLAKKEKQTAEISAIVATIPCKSESVKEEVTQKLVMENMGDDYILVDALSKYIEDIVIDNTVQTETDPQLQPIPIIG